MRKKALQSLAEKSLQSIVEIGKRNLNAENHWELLDLDNLKFEKPTVLCFSGNATLTNEDANGLAKMVENYLGLMFTPKQDYHLFDHIDILGVKYARLSKNIGCLDESAVEQIANAIFSLLVDGRGQRLNLQQAKQNMSRITFFTFCAGNQELVKVIGTLNQKLADVGYEADEIYAINRASLEVSYAPENIMYNRIPSVRVLSQHPYDYGRGGAIRPCFFAPYAQLLAYARLRFSILFQTKIAFVSRRNCNVKIASVTTF